ncbi:MAG: glycosyltransferase, partial [Leptolyngbyaceae cyanobacterium bins.59]|nr:glycosyltransferase [Leptolyngbyaceae cyanobacterium bins.59]
EGAFSLTLYSLELLGLLSYGIQLFMTLRERDRRKDADFYGAAVLAGAYLPDVDVLIPTYNEPAVVLRRTIVGCQAMDYPNKRIYVLDDGKRPEIRDLAAELGCEYVTRPDNRHAKAGNLNYAIDRTQGELIAVFDADFVPTRPFLLRTVGFFQNQRIGLVQTPQTFYNPDPINSNLGLEQVPPGEEVFYRHIHLLRDAADSSICVGSSFVVRRSALEAIGGFTTSSLAEDYCTGINLTARGYDLAYLNEKLSAGLAAENMAAYIAQRSRWARGTLQVLFIRENPLTIPGLRLRQRLVHLEGLMQWFNNLSRAFFLIAPIVASLLSVHLFNTTLSAWVYYFLPLYVGYFSTYHWLNRQAQSALLSDVTSVINCLPIASTVIQTLIRPFSKGFSVTPKGIVNDRSVFQWQLALPLLILWVFTTGNLGYQIWMWATWTAPVMSDSLYSLSGLKLGLFWSLYNLLILVLALLSFLDRPRTDLYPWFEGQQPVDLDFGGKTIHGMTCRLSEIGAELVFEAGAIESLSKDTFLSLTLPAENLKLMARVYHIEQKHSQIHTCVFFENLSTAQQRSLIELLFCQPGQWKSQNAPGEWELLKQLGHRIQQSTRQRSLSGN